MLDSSRTADVTAETRKSRIPKRNKKGQRPVKIGGRSDYKVFKFSRSVSDKEVEERTVRLKQVFDACGGWNALSNFIAEHVRKGIVSVPLPDKELCGNLGVRFDGWVHWRSVLVANLPSIPWATLGESSVSPAVLAGIRHVSISRLNEAAETIADIDGTPNRVVFPVSGTLHDAFYAYSVYVQKTDSKNFDRQGKIRQFVQRHADQPLATLGLDACRELIDYWRQRPHATMARELTRPNEAENSLRNSFGLSNGCI